MNKIFTLIAVAVLALTGLNASATTYWLSGGYNGWSTADSSDYGFTDNGDGTHTLTLEEFYGEFKIITSGGGTWYGYGTIELDTEYTLSTSGGNITLPSSTDTYTNVVFTVTVSGSTLTLKVTSSGSKETEMTYYLCGGFNSWTQMASDYAFTNNGDGTYSLATSSSGHTTSTGFKIMTDTQLWYGYASGYNIDYDTEYTFSTSGNDTYLNVAPSGDYLYFTFTPSGDTGILVVSETAPSDGISAVEADGITVIANAGAITVTGTEDVKVYNLGGSLIGTGASNEVPAGMYIVKAGDVTQKVIVK